MRQEWLARRLEHMRPGRSQRGLARAIGIPPSRASEIVSGKRRIAVTEVPAVAGYLRMRVEDVVHAICAASANIGNLGGQSSG